MKKTGYLDRFIIPMIIGLSLVLFSRCEVTDFLMGGRVLEERAPRYLVEVEVLLLEADGSEVTGETGDITIVYPEDELVQEDNGAPTAASDVEITGAVLRASFLFEGARPYVNPPVIAVTAAAALTGSRELTVRVWYREPEATRPEYERELLGEAFARRGDGEAVTVLRKVSVVTTAVPY